MNQTQAPIEELTAWLQLTMTPKLGPVQVLLLLSEFGLPQHILAQPIQSLKRVVSTEVATALRANPTSEQEQLIQIALHWAQAEDQHIITMADAHYPQHLFNLHDPPILLYAKGNLELLKKPNLAIVGARNASILGSETAREFARYLSARDWCISSGLATGIDTAAHTGALEAVPSKGSTIAVLATGMNIVYPASNRALAHKIAAQGLLLSEYALDTRARPYHFPQRNRLVAALSQGVLVVEAALRSGSLITAKLASEIGREVFAIPGSIHDPLSRGCHALIKQGAKLVESGADILEELAPRHPSSVKPQPMSGERLQDNHALWTEYPWLKQMGYDPISFEQLLHLSQQSTHELSAQLTELELLGHLQRLAGGRYQQRPPTET